MRLESPFSEIDSFRSSYLNVAKSIYAAGSNNVDGLLARHNTDLVPIAYSLFSVAAEEKKGFIINDPTAIAAARHLIAVLNQNGASQFVTDHTEEFFLTSATQWYWCERYEHPHRYFLSPNAVRRFSFTRVSGLGKLEMPYKAITICLGEPIDGYGWISVVRLHDEKRAIVYGHKKSDGLWAPILRHLLPLDNIAGAEDQFDQENDLDVATTGIGKRLQRIAINTIMFAANAPERVLLHDQSIFLAKALRRELTASKSASESAHTKERISRLPDYRDRNRYIVIGYDMPTIDKNSSGGNKLQVRTLVTGHWRNQAVGPAHGQRKLIWIEPFWRGPDDAELSNPVRGVM